MLRNKKFYLGIAILAIIIYLWALASNNLLIRIFSKPLPVLILAILLDKKNRYQKLIFVGFIFSFIGDILLELPFDLFMFGLLAFLLAHISYILAFLSRNKNTEFFSLFLLLIIGGCIYYFIFPNLGKMSVAVAIYILVILTMVWRSYAQRKYDKYAITAFLGALFFLFSDSNIAIDKFCCAYSLSNWIIIITYWIAQYLIFYSADKTVKE
jgi:uncharacterized membrane protein YhhN